MALYQKEMSYLGEIIPLSEMFFHEMPELGEEEQEVINGEQVPELMTHLYGKLEALEPFEAVTLRKQLKKYKRKQVLKVNNYSCLFVLCNWSNARP